MDTIWTQAQIYVPNSKISQAGQKSLPSWKFIQK
jgi:hypothetical protein